MFDDDRHAELESERFELLGLLCEALDAYDAGEADLLAVVHDVDSVIVELTLISDPTWIEHVRSQWKLLACALAERGRPEAPPHAADEVDSVAQAIQGLRFLASQPVLAE